MTLIDEYFLKKSDNLSFIELKDYVELELKGMRGTEIPLPIVSDILAEGISDGNLADKVDTEMILDGMIYLIGSDPKSELGEEYLRILKNYDEKMDDYIFFKGIKFLDKELEERAEVYFRALKKLNPDHILGRFNYGLALERVAQNLLNKDEQEAGMEFLGESTHEFESILDIDEKYPLAYYKLGYHYKFSNQFLKAKLMWEKYINLDEDELRIQEVREQIDVIDDDVALETGLTYLSYNKFDEALDSFLSLLPRHGEWWELRYLIGTTYAGLNDVDNAIKEYKLALDLNDQVEDVYNELGIELFKRGDIRESISVYTEGINKLGDKYKLYFNRGLGLMQLGELDGAYRDVSKAHELNPIDENIKETKEEIESSI